MAEPARRITRSRTLVTVAIVVAVLLTGTRPTGAGAAAPADPVGTLHASAAAERALPSSDGRGAPSLPEPDRDPGEVRDRARRILARDEFRGPRTGRSLLQRIIDWIRARIPKLRTPRGRLRGSGLAAWAVIAMVGAAALFLAARGLIALRSGRRSRSDDAGVDPDEAEITPLRDPDQWRAEAERCEAAGAWRDAVRARYRATTGTLAERVVILDLPGRTAGEHRAEVAQWAPEAAAPFDALARLFEAAWFGSVPIGAEAAERARELSAQTLAAAPRRGRRGAGVSARDDGRGGDEDAHDRDPRTGPPREPVEPVEPVEAGR
ncbi:MAG: DUF4129 domain-containing protein [Actinobacteria bacterium]|nr:DUF4129 domain-containing protein [Actinomycetota bacterium]